MNLAHLVKSLPFGLSYREAAARIGLPYQRVRLAMIRDKYPVADGRGFSQNGRRKLNPALLDWSKSNIALARQWKCSRERVRTLRQKLGLPKIESRGRRKKSR